MVQPVVRLGGNAIGQEKKFRRVESNVYSHVNVVEYNLVQIVLKTTYEPSPTLLPSVEHYIPVIIYFGGSKEIFPLQVRIGFLIGIEIIISRRIFNEA